LLETLRSGQRWITALLIGLVGFVFVLFLGFQGSLQSGSSAGAIVTVGPYSFDYQEFERTRARREAMLQQQLGDQFDPKVLGDMLDQATARELVDRALLALEADSLGLRVSTEEIERFVLDDPSFRDENGVFNVENFESWAEYEYGSQSAFIEERRLALLSFKMLDLLYGQPQVSPAEAEEAVKRDLEEVQIAFVAVAPEAKDAESASPDEAALKLALDERSGDLHAAYEERNAVYNVPEKIRVRHILFAVPAGADDAAAEKVKAEAEAALVSLRGGADFEKLAAERSDDPGSKTRGGDLGFFARGQMVPDFENAAFALTEAGQLSEVVRSTYGFHLIRFEERQAPVARSYDEVREELAKELLTEEFRKARARERADALAAAVREGKPLEVAAREADLPLERSGWLRRRPDGFVPGLGPAQDLLAAVFTTPPGTSLPRVFEAGERLALVQVLERKEPPEDQVRAMVAARREQLLAEKRDARSAAWLDHRRKQLVEDGSLVIALDKLGRSAPVQ
jgi:peptidyl-prolyl cis-trans isomerase D